MNKRFPIAIYQRYWRSWRGSAFVLLALSLALLFFAPEPLRPYRPVLMLAAGLAALTLALGFAMTALAFVSVGKDAVIVQLPLWRVRIPHDQIYATRTVSLEGAVPRGWKDPELAQMPAVYLEMRSWPQPRPTLRLWLGKLVVGDGLLLPTERTLELRRALDSAALELREARREKPTANGWSRPMF